MYSALSLRLVAHRGIQRTTNVFIIIIMNYSGCKHSHFKLYTVLKTSTQAPQSSSLGTQNNISTKDNKWTLSKVHTANPLTAAMMGFRHLVTMSQSVKKLELYVSAKVFICCISLMSAPAERQSNVWNQLQNVPYRQVYLHSNKSKNKQYIEKKCS